ncbi:MAG: tyrosine-type recombinase/integrase [Alphaproteobacteria bacterium]|nr:tyrosine-type recombinase/integrase [Alphaproteobacteria bacterium]
MSARNEHQVLIENKIKEKIKEMPQIITDYFYSLEDKTAETKYTYIMHVISFFEYLSEDGIDVNNISELANIKTSYMNKYMNNTKYKDEEKKQEYSYTYRIAKMAAISCLFEMLNDDGYMDNNPCDKVKIKNTTEEKDIIALTPKEYKIIEKNIRNNSRYPWVYRDLAIFNLGCTTGLRIQELIEIDLEDIDLMDGIMTIVGKGNVKRKIYLSEKTISYLENWIEEREDIMENNSGALFISNRKTRLSKTPIRNMIEKNSECIGKHISPHKMRATCATNLYNKTGDIYLTQQTLGHKNISTTKRYAKIDEEKRKNAATVLGKLF